MPAIACDRSHLKILTHIFEPQGELKTHFGKALTSRPKAVAVKAECSRIEGIKK